MKTFRIFLVLLFIFSLAVIACDEDSGSKTSVPASVEGAPIAVFAASGTDGRELWKTDGTTAGTAQVLDINTGGDSFNPSIYDGYMDEFGYLNNRAYFRANNGTDGFELWVSDGTATGTHIVRDINTAGDSNPQAFIVFGSRLYFSATTAAGTELWKTDGTEAGTIKAVAAGGPTLLDPSEMAVYDNRLYFAAKDSGIEGLWSVDGNGNAREITIPDAYTAGCLPRRMIMFKGILYFTAWTTADGRALWSTDGTDEATAMVADISTGTGDVLMKNFTPYNDKLYFSADGGTTGQELWMTDGTEEGTELAADIYPGAAGSSPEYLIALNGRLYFAGSSAEGTVIYVFDSVTGTAGKMPLVYDTYTASGPDYLTLFDNQIYFQATISADSNLGTELWVSDGTAYGTHLVGNINPTGDSTPRYFKIMKNRLYFSATTGSPDQALWTTDGTESGTDEVSSSCLNPLGYD